MSGGPCSKVPVSSFSLTFFPSRIIPTPTRKQVTHSASSVLGPYQVPTMSLTIHYPQRPGILQCAYTYMIFRVEVLSSCSTGGITMVTQSLRTSQLENTAKSKTPEFVIIDELEMNKSENFGSRSTSWSLHFRAQTVLSGVVVAFYTTYDRK